MGRVAAAGAVLVALVVLGAPPAAGAELSGVFQFLVKHEGHFINGTEKVRYVQRHIHNREQLVHFDSDVGVFVGDTPYGVKQARCWNNKPRTLEYVRTLVDDYCRPNYVLDAPFSVERRVPPSVSISLVPSNSKPSPGRLLCSMMNFYPADIQVRWFQGQQELSGHVMTTDIVPNGDWTYQLLVLLQTPPQRGVTFTCQVEHISLEHPLSRHWDPPSDSAGHRPQQDADGDRGLRVGLRLPGTGAWLLPAQEELLSRCWLQPLPVASGPARSRYSDPC